VVTILRPRLSETLNQLGHDSYIDLNQVDPTNGIDHGRMIQRTDWLQVVGLGWLIAIASATVTVAILWLS
jgi:hypothetical protein